MARLALATASAMDTADADEQLLLPLLPDAELAAWDDAGVDWARYDAVILRSTWNYTDHLDAFLAWVDDVARVTRLVNPASVIKWNTDKRYLGELAAAGVDIVPTTYVAPGQGLPPDSLHGHVVVKPTVGAGSKGAALFYDDAKGATAHVEALHGEGRIAMIQPYLDGVDTHGETALVYIGGEFSHAARKAAILSRHMTWSTGLYADEEISPAEPTPEEHAVAERVMEALPGLVEGAEHLAYARVDLLPGPLGPVLLELELTEPSLFLACDASAPARAAAVFGALARE